MRTVSEARAEHQRAVILTPMLPLGPRGACPFPTRWRCYVSERSQMRVDTPHGHARDMAKCWYYSAAIGWSPCSRRSAAVQLLVIRDGKNNARNKK